MYDEDVFEEIDSDEYENELDNYVDYVDNKVWIESLIKDIDLGD